jgi:ketosteroid isomerase-like protein
MTKFRETLVMMILMTIMMGLAISGWFTWQATGFSAGFFAEWISRFLSTYVIVFPAVLAVLPIAQKMAAMINHRIDAMGMGNTAIDPRETALEAWRANASGHRGEGFSAWYQMLDENIIILMPLGPYRGDNRGPGVANKIYEAIASASPRLTYEQPLRVTQNGDTVVIEFNDHGTIAGLPYRNRIAASFDIKNGKVAAYREYFGDIDPHISAMMNSSGNQTNAATSQSSTERSFP